MKKNLLFFIVIFITCNKISASEGLWNTSFKNYRFSSSLSNDFSYRYCPVENWEFYHESKYIFDKEHAGSKEKNTYSNLKWRLSKNYGIFYNSLEFGYLYQFTESSFQVINYDFTQRLRNTAFTFALTPSELFEVKSKIIYHHNRERVNETENNLYLSNGIGLKNYLRFSRLINNNEFKFNSYFKNLKLDFDNNRNYGYDLTWNFQKNKQIFNSEIKYDWHRNDIYTFYKITDQQIRYSYLSRVEYSFPVFKNVRFTIQDRYYLLNNNFRKEETKIRKNLKEESNHINSGISILWKKYRLNMNFGRNFHNRYYEMEVNSQEASQKIFNSELIYRFNEKDSLFFYRKLELQQVDIPLEESIMDYDQLNDNMQIAFFYYPKDRIFLTTNYSYFQQKFVYLKSEMSDQNTIKKSYNLQPKLEIAIFGNWIIKQNYHIRADYEDFVWTDLFEELPQGHFFRSILVSYTLIYDQSESFSLSSFRKWKHLNVNKFSVNPIMIQFRFDYKANNYGNKNNDVYEIISENESQTMIINITKQFSKFDIFGEAKILYGNFTEYNFLLSVDYNLKQNAKASIQINPISDWTKKFEWNIDCRLEYTF